MDDKVRADFKKAKDDWDSCVLADFYSDRSTQDAITAIMEALGKNWHVDEE